MLQSNYIGFLLNLKEVSVVNYNEHSVVLSLPRKFHTCPCCNHKTDKIHDYRLQKIKHFFKTENLISIFIRKCRYVCPKCHKCFLEQIPFLGRFQRMTVSLKKAIISQFFETKSASSIAKEHIRKRLETGFTNGYTEGMNNKIKVFKRVGYGVKRFDRFRKRIIYVGAGR